MTYPGGKAGAGVWQRLICQIPPHDVWVSGFAGHCAVTRNLLPARRRIVIDRDPSVAEWWRGQAVECYCCDAVEWLRHAFGLYRLPAPPDLATVPAEPPIVAASAGLPARAPSPIVATGDEAAEPGGLVPGPGCVAEFGGVGRSRQIQRPCRTVVYCDPPYPRNARRSNGRLYTCEMSDDQHADLLDVLLRLPCYVLVHSYPNPLYRERLAGWRTWTYRSQTRGGPATEQVWANYPEPDHLHDYRWIGRSKREREKLARRRRRLIRWLDCLPPRERAQLLAAVADRFGGVIRLLEEPTDSAARYPEAAGG